MVRAVKQRRKRSIRKRACPIRPSLGAFRSPLSVYSSFKLVPVPLPLPPLLSLSLSHLFGRCVENNHRVHVLKGPCHTTPLCSPRVLQEASRMRGPSVLAHRWNSSQPGASEKPAKRLREQMLIIRIETRWMELVLSLEMRWNRGFPIL